MTRTEALTCAVVCFLGALLAVLLIKFLSLGGGFSLLAMTVGVSVGVLYGCEVDRRSRLRQRGRTR